MRLGKDSKSDSPNGNSASPASIACCDYYHPLLIASFVHIKLPPFPNCLRTCKSSLDVRTNHVQSQPTVTRAETGSLSAYLSGTESSLPSTPPFFLRMGTDHRRYLLKRGATSQISEWKNRNTSLIHSLGLLPGHRNRDQCEVYQVPRPCPKSRRRQSISGTARRTQVLTTDKCTALLKSGCASSLKPS